MLGPARYGREGFKYGIDTLLLPTLLEIGNSVLEEARASHASSVLIYLVCRHMHASPNRVEQLSAWHDMVFVTLLWLLIVASEINYLIITTRDNKTRHKQIEHIA